jgi:phage terminase large subunit-like protein
MKVRAVFAEVVKTDGYGVMQWLPQDPGQAGVDQVQSYVRSMPGYRVECERMSGSKETRAHAVACAANIGAVSMLGAPWNAAPGDCPTEIGCYPA